MFGCHQITQQIIEREFQMLLWTLKGRQPYLNCWESHWLTPQRYKSRITQKGTKTIASSRRNQLAIQAASLATSCARLQIGPLVIRFGQEKWLKIQMHTVLILSFLRFLGCPFIIVFSNFWNNITHSDRGTFCDSHNPSWVVLQRCLLMVLTQPSHC